MISKEQVEHIAKLARIKLTEKEGEKFSKELSSILDFIGQLDRVNTKNIKPIQQITELENVVREDEPKKRNPKIRDKILEQTPDRKDNYFKVPKIFD